MLFNIEAILSKDNGSVHIRHSKLQEPDKKFNVTLVCKFGSLEAYDKSVVDAITKILHSYRVLEENEVTVHTVPF